jgi:hypothetical protein
MGMEATPEISNRLGVQKIFRNYLNLKI